MSKVMWLNLATLIGVALTAVADHELVLQNPVVVGGIGIALAVVNVVKKWLASKVKPTE